MKKIKTLTVILALLFLLTACIPTKSSTLKRAEEDLELDLSKSHIVENIESNRGIHGDGESYLKLLLENPDELLGSIEKSDYWHDLSELENHKEDMNYLILHNEKDEDVTDKLHKEIESVKNGYFFFLNRETEHMEKEKVVFKSFNFTFAVFNKDKGEILYLESDM